MWAESVSPVGAQEANLIAPQSESGVIGQLKLGQTAVGELLGADETGSRYHTYVVELPEDQQQLVVEMQADEDLDLAIKQGSPIEAYGEQADWTLADTSLENTATLTIPAPDPGTWYIDVINSLDIPMAVPYQLQVK